MTDKEDFKHHVRRMAIMTLAFAAGMVFGIILLATGDWIPGGIIVTATVIGLAVEIPVIRTLCSTDPTRSAPGSRSAS